MTSRRLRSSRCILPGEFGSDPEKINPYAASTFYAVDRYAGFARGWKDFYDKGGLIVCDRYTTSNAVHQGSKLQGEKQAEFFTWLYDLEYDKMGLPRPDLSSASTCRPSLRICCGKAR